MKRVFILILVVLFVVSSGLFVTGYMPGTIRRDANGALHGTGYCRYYYDSGALKLEEYYLAGRPRTSRWFHPNGSLIAETRWREGNGVGYFLRDDGSILSKMEFRNGLAHGRATYFKEDGLTVDYVAEFQNGQKLEH